MKKKHEKLKADHESLKKKHADLVRGGKKANRTLAREKGQKIPRG